MLVMTVMTISIELVVLFYQLGDDCKRKTPPNGRRRSKM
jgi:hypothetical protein